MNQRTRHDPKEMLSHILRLSAGSVQCLGDDELRSAMTEISSYASNAHGALTPLQDRVEVWLDVTFGPEIANDRDERNHRYLEESLELVQACGLTASEAYQLVDYVFSRPVGERSQEVGGAVITLAALCLAQRLDMDQSGEDELDRIWTKVEQIREKQRNKPKFSPLPAAPQLTTDATPPEQHKMMLREWRDTMSAVHAHVVHTRGVAMPAELFARVSAAFTSMGAAIESPPQSIGFVIEHADGGRWRTLDTIGMPDWTDDPADALCMTLRKHADAFAGDDPEDVRIRPAYAKPAAVSKELT